ncbi:MAG: MFS transporter [Chloroflexi bacterium]|nr:MFS transporter [Chloroflexota bacterium]
MTTATGPVQEELGPFSSLRFPGFRYLWAGAIFSSVGQWLQQLSLGWVVYDLTGSGALLGTLNSMRGVTTLTLGLSSGVVIDRVDRRKLLLWIPLALLVSSSILGGLLLLDRVQVWHLFVFMAFFGLMQAFDHPLRNTVIFDVVPRSHTPNAVTLNTSSFTFTRALGPSVGGYLIAWFGAGGTFFVQAFAYLIAAATRFRIALPPKPQSSRRSLMKDFREGAAYVVRERVTRSYILIGLVAYLLLIPTFSTLSPIYAKDVFGRGPEALGFLIGAVGAGGIIGAFFMASLGKVERRGLLQLWSLLAFAMSLIAFSYTPSLWLALPALALAGFTEMIFLTTNSVLVQLSVPDELRARVSSILVLNNGILPLGALIAGFSADHLGAPMVTRLTAGIAAIIAVAVFFGSPTVRNTRLSQLIASGPHAAPVRSGMPQEGSRQGTLAAGSVVAGTEKP